jgi:hypothetical protein
MIRQLDKILGRVKISRGAKYLLKRVYREPRGGSDEKDLSTSRHFQPSALGPGSAGDKGGHGTGATSRIKIL